MSSSSQKFALEKATSELEIQIKSQIEDYVTQMTAVNLRFKQLDNECEALAIIEVDRERFCAATGFCAATEADWTRFRAAAFEFMHLEALQKKLDDDLKAIFAKNIKLKEMLILLMELIEG